ncbi:MAG: DUF58 domain-containing protein [Rhodopirellula sp.]|nr:DUF58 domain-containing protein [Rhodopirellula sp.]
MSDKKSPTSSRPVPLLGFLSLFAGAGMFHTSEQLAGRAGEWNLHVQIIGNLIGVVLIFWGIRLVAGRFARAGSKVGRLNRNRVMLPREGMMYLLIMIVAFVASLIGRSNMLMLVFSIMAGPFIVNGWVTFSLLQSNRVRRTVPTRAMCGERVSVEVSLQNRKLWFSSWLMMVRDRVGRSSDGGYLGPSAEIGLEPTVLFASVRPGTERRACYQLRLNHRGRYLFGPLEVSTRFPLGLVERGFITDERGEMLVYPQIGTLSSRWHRDAQLAAEMIERQQTRKGMFEDEFHHLRNFRPGDSTRNVHWRTSARMNQLMVQEFHQSRDQGLIVVLDLWQPERPSTEDIERVELAVSFAATICVEHLKQTRGVEQVLSICGRKSIRLRYTTIGQAVESLLDTLALVEGGTSNGLADAVADASKSMTALTRCVLLTTRQDDRALASNLPDEAIPNLEIIHADPQQLAQWFTLNNASPPLHSGQDPDSMSSDLPEVAAL